MFFNYYTNQTVQLSRGFAKGLFVIGLLLIGFGVLVYILKEVLAAIAAAIFAVVGIFCCINAVKIFFQSSRTKKGPQQEGRENVTIRFED